MDQHSGEGGEDVLLMEFSFSWRSQIPCLLSFFKTLTWAGVPHPLTLSSLLSLLQYITSFCVTQLIVDLGEQSIAGVKHHLSLLFSFLVCLTHIEKYRGWHVEAHGIVHEAVTKTIPKKKKCRKAKCLPEEALQRAEKRREAKGKRGIPVWMHSSKK